MPQIGQSVSTTNVDVASQASALQGAEEVDKVGSGNLDGKPISTSKKTDESNVLIGQKSPNAGY